MGSWVRKVFPNTKVIKKTAEHVLCMAVKAKRDVPITCGYNHGDQLIIQPRSKLFVQVHSSHEMKNSKAIFCFRLSPPASIECTQEQATWHLGFTCLCALLLGTHAILKYSSHYKADYMSWLVSSWDELSLHHLSYAIHYLFAFSQT